MSRDGERRMFELDLAGVSRDSIAFGKIDEKRCGVFVCTAKVKEILQQVGGYRGRRVWIEADLVQNPRKERRAETPYALLASGKVYSVAIKEPVQDALSLVAAAESAPAATSSQATEEPAIPASDEQATEPAASDDGQSDKPQSALFVDPDEFTPDAMIDIPGGRMHGTLAGLVGFIIEAVGEIKITNEDVRMATAVLALEHGCDREKLEAAVRHQMGRVYGMRMGAVCNRVLELMPELVKAAGQAPTIADVTVADHPDAIVRLTKAFGIQSQDDAVELALVEDATEAVDGAETGAG